MHNEKEKPTARSVDCKGFINNALWKGWYVNDICSLFLRLSHTNVHKFIEKAWNEWDTMNCSFSVRRRKKRCRLLLTREISSWQIHFLNRFNSMHDFMFTFIFNVILCMYLDGFSEGKLELLWEKNVSKALESFYRLGLLFPMIIYGKQNRKSFFNLTGITDLMWYVVWGWRGEVHMGHADTSQANTFVENFFFLAFSSVLKVFFFFCNSCSSTNDWIWREIMSLIFLFLFIFFFFFNNSHNMNFFIIQQCWWMIIMYRRMKATESATIWNSFFRPAEWFYFQSKVDSKKIEELEKSASKTGVT